MIQLSIELKNKAKRLRKTGFSLKEISDKLNISKSTSSLWLRNIDLSLKAQQRLQKRKIFGQYKTILVRKNKRDKCQKELNKQSSLLLDQFSLDQRLSKILCSLIYFCEGAKRSDTLVTIINSDPNLIALFLALFRKSFNISEEKFRVIMHLHEYHDENKQKMYWSKITGIVTSQFRKTYIKPNTKKRIRESYPGCVSIRYYDAIIAKELLSLFKVFSIKFSYRAVG